MELHPQDEGEDEEDVELEVQQSNPGEKVDIADFVYAVIAAAAAK